MSGNAAYLVPSRNGSGIEPRVMVAPLGEQATGPILIRNAKSRGSE
jgi:hypothetical protein